MPEVAPVIRMDFWGVGLSATDAKANVANKMPARRDSSGVIFILRFIEDQPSIATALRLPTAPRWVRLAYHRSHKDPLTHDPLPHDPLPMTRSGLSLKGANDAGGNPAPIEVTWLGDNRLTVYGAVNFGRIERRVIIEGPKTL